MTNDEKMQVEAIDPTFDPVADANEKRRQALNMAVHTIDSFAQTVPEIEAQLSVLMVAAALCFKRVLFKHKIIDGPRKKIILDRAMKDFEAKVRKYGWTAEEPKKAVLTSS